MGEIIASVLGPDKNSSTESEDGEATKITIAEGLSIGEQYLSFLETHSCNTEQEILTICRMQRRLNKHKFDILKQTELPIN